MQFKERHTFGGGFKIPETTINKKKESLKRKKNQT